MANIDLNKIFIKKPAITSPVDSDIKLNEYPKNDELFSDFKLDLRCEINNDDSINSTTTHHDIAKIVNEESILNSLRNILSTRYFSRLLNPEMNFDLRNYLFEDITEAKAFFIGYDINMYLPIHEPRVVLKDTSVIAHYNHDAYSINLTFYIPSISKNLKLSSILNSDGLTFA